MYNFCERYLTTSIERCTYNVKCITGAVARLAKRKLLCRDRTKLEIQAFSGLKELKFEHQAFQAQNQAFQAQKSLKVSEKGLILSSS